jgi:hypothetical protein
MLSRRNANPDELRAVTRPDLQSLSYMVFEGQELVAAFAMRDDAEHWIEECGHPAMELRDMSAVAQLGQSKRARPDKYGEKAGGVVARRR